MLPHTNYFLCLATLTLCLSLTSEVRWMVYTQNVCSELSMPLKYCKHKQLQVIKEFYVMIWNPPGTSQWAHLMLRHFQKHLIPKHSKGGPARCPPQCAPFPFPHTCLADTLFVLRSCMLFKNMVTFLYFAPIDLNCVSPFLSSGRAIYSLLFSQKCLPHSACRPFMFTCYQVGTTRSLCAVHFRPAFPLGWFGMWKTTEMSLKWLQLHERCSLQSWVLCHGYIFFI